MKTNFFMLVQFLIGLGLLQIATSPIATAQSKPNVIFIMVDDAGYQDFIKYKNLKDSRGTKVQQHFAFKLLEERAIKFTHFYTNPTCSPTRMSLMTGNNPVKTGIEHAVCVPDSKVKDGTARGIPSDAMTIPKKMNRLGYRTAHVGKWHIGERAGKKPADQGFHDTIVYKYDNHKFWDPEFHTYIGRSRTRTRIESGYKTKILTDISLQLMEKHKNHHRSKPLFMNVWYNAPHHPFQPPQWAIDRFFKGSKSQFSKLNSKDRELYKFMAVMYTLDQQINRIIQKVKNDSHFKNNTIVMLTSDNGGAAKKDNYSNAPLEGAKGKLFEGGVRLPLYVYSPSRFSKGINHSLLRSSDLLATLTTLAGGSVDFITEGESFAHLLNNTRKAEKKQRKRPIMIAQRGQIKYCDYKGAFLRARGYETGATWRQMVRRADSQGDWKYIMQVEKGQFEEHLFDFSKRTHGRSLEDESSRSNLARHPSFQSKRQEMKNLLYHQIIRKSAIPMALQNKTGQSSVSSNRFTLTTNGSGGRAHLPRNDRYETHDGSFTFSVKVRPSAKAMGRRSMIAQRHMSWTLFLLPDRRIELAVRDEDTGKVAHLFSQTKLNANREYNVTFSITGHTGNNKSEDDSTCTRTGKKWTFVNNVARLYVDPATQSSQPNVEALNASEIFNVNYTGYSNLVYIGRGKQNLASESFYGKITLLGAFAMPLTTEQVHYLYRNPLN
ncbi:MAG: sulfatase-like hydrolase/transferase [Bdellovibrionales bacterium]|nr:sulfatase-like hydrolase/transferase [Bdellovibrionales bacterium]